MTRSRTALAWLAISALAIAVIAPLPYLLSPLPQVGNDFARAYELLPDWRQAGFYLHIVSGGVALALSPLQLSSRVRRRRPRLHRVNGRVVASAILLSGVGAFAVVPANHAGLVGDLGFGALALTWAWCAILTVTTARRRDLVSHRRWAVRTFALTYAAVTLRLWLGVLVGAGMPFDTAYHLVPFLSWVPNLAVAELHLRAGSQIAAAMRTRSRPSDFAT